MCHRIGTSGNYCEYTNELSSSTKGGKFDYLSDYKLINNSTLWSYAIPNSAEGFLFRCSILNQGKRIGGFLGRWKNRQIPPEFYYYLSTDTSQKLEI
jgi:hypothetical protein